MNAMRSATCSLVLFQSLRDDLLQSSCEYELGARNDLSQFSTPYSGGFRATIERPSSNGSTKNSRPRLSNADSDLLVHIDDTFVPSLATVTWLLTVDKVLTILIIPVLPQDYGHRDSTGSQDAHLQANFIFGSWWPAIERMNDRSDVQKPKQARKAEKPALRRFSQQSRGVK